MTIFIRLHISLWVFLFVAIYLELDPQHQKLILVTLTSLPTMLPAVKFRFLSLQYAYLRISPLLNSTYTIYNGACTVFLRLITSVYYVNVYWLLQSFNLLSGCCLSCSLPRLYRSVWVFYGHLFIYYIPCSSKACWTIRMCTLCLTYLCISGFKVGSGS